MKDPAFLFYSNDFLAGTMFLTDKQVGKYIRLLCLQHQKGRLSKKDMLDICKTYDEDIWEKFNVDSEGFFYNKRLRDESERRKNYSESRRQNRLKTRENVGKTQKVEKDMSNICKIYDATYVEHMETETETITNSLSFDVNNSVNNINTENTESVCSVTEGSIGSITGDTGGARANAPRQELSHAQQGRFDRFWAAYPKKVGKGQALRVWKRLNPDEATTDDIIAGVSRAKEKDRRFDDPQFIPHPATWLNSRGWEDNHDVEISRHRQNNGGNGGSRYGPQPFNVDAALEVMRLSDELTEGKNIGLIGGVI